jgi:hypothetical protein
MAQTKLCSSCNELKPTTKFSKHKKNKDGLQCHCKSCQNKRVSALVKADRDGSIYSITNPLGEVYTGRTNREPHHRFVVHKAHYKHQKANGYSNMPKLHASFDTWGVDAHIFNTVATYPNISKKDLRDIESRMIIALKRNGKSLNVNN